ncbi:MAG: hypothetical protein H7A23_04360 [Leptospiraceae bacterium]|nr:hypothetical protein [Leptospiraceae bacterium]MCP5493766.1 hypothetical protein [Leptospiraceae bacterium]
MRTTCKNGEFACLCTYNPACPDFTTAKETCLALIQYADRCNNGDTINNHAFFPMDNNGDGKRELFRLVGNSNSEEGIQFNYQEIGEGNYDNKILVDQKYTIQYNSFLSMGDVDGKDDFVYTSANEGEEFHSLYVAYSSATSQTGYGFHSPTKTSILTSIPKLRIKKSLESQATIGKQWLVDINHDGRMDFVQKIENPDDKTEDREKKSWVLSVRLSNGGGFDSEKLLNLDHNAIAKVDGEWEYADEFTQITDMDGSDGKLDYVNIKKGTNTISVYKIDLENLTLTNTQHSTSVIRMAQNPRKKERIICGS